MSMSVRRLTTVCCKQAPKNPELFQTLKNANPFFLISGPCALESTDHGLAVADTLKTIGQRCGIPIVFKASFDKANRTSWTSPRGMGLREGLKSLELIKNQIGIPVLTDIHEPWQADFVAEVVDILQIPAFLCRQTDLLLAAANTRVPVNIKKGQFASAEVMKHAVEKIKATGNEQALVTDRGTMFGYDDLIMDPRNLVWLRGTGAPVIQDVTHAIQRPLGNESENGAVTSGRRHLVPAVARAAVAVGVDGLFFEVHDKPDEALSDSATVWPLDELEELLVELKDIALASRGREASQ